MVSFGGSNICNDILTFAVVTNSGPTHGTLSAITQTDATNASVTYTPTNVGLDSFTFKAYDGASYSSNATVQIAVLPKPKLTAYCRPESIWLRWEIPAWEWDGGYVEDFVIHRATNGGGHYSVIGTVPAESRDFRDTNVTAGVTYHYMVSFHYNYTNANGVFGGESPVSNEAATNTCSLPPGNPMDVAFIVDNTSSMSYPKPLDELRNGIATVLDDLAAASGTNYRLALVTPDDDIVNVRTNFAATNRSAFVTALSLVADPPGHGSNGPESTDECLNTIVNALSASNRTNINSNSCPGKPAVQINNFTPGFRTNALKRVVLITDYLPGGFCGCVDPYPTILEHAHGFALQARAKCIKVNVIQVDNDLETEVVMRDYAQTTYGWYSQIPDNGEEIAEAVRRMFYEPGACSCPP